MGDRVFLTIFPLKGVIRFGKWKKLSPRIIRPYKITERVGPVAYHLALPPNLEGVHDMFHVSMLWRYRSNHTHILKEQLV